MMEVEPDIWLVAIVSKAWGGAGCSNSSLTSALDSLHQLFVLLHRPLSHLIDKVRDASILLTERANHP